MLLDMVGEDVGPEPKTEAFFSVFLIISIDLVMSFLIATFQYLQVLRYTQHHSVFRACLNFLFIYSVLNVSSLLFLVSFCSLLR